MGRREQPQPTQHVLSEEVVDALLRKLRARGSETLVASDYDALLGVVETWAHLTELADKESASIEEIRRVLGLGRPRRRGATTKADPPGAQGSDTDQSTGEAAQAPGAPTATSPSERQRNDHGRRKPEAFGKLAQVHHAHHLLHSGDACPECLRGRVYKYRPSSFTTISGRSPLVATRHTVDSLQCNLCKAVFKAPLPVELEADGVSGLTLYTYSAVAIVGIYRFFSGQPMHRQESLQSVLGVPVPDASIWDMCERLAEAVRPIRDVLLARSADALVFFGDDTGATVLSERSKVIKNRRTGEDVVRTGCHTTCVIALTADDHAVTLFSTGIHHTGEVMDLVLAERAASSPAPVFMGDCIASNTVSVTPVLYAGCNAHAVRRFKALCERYPEQTAYALERYRKIYEAEAACVEGGKSAQERCDYHREHSRPLLREICEHGEDLFEQRLVGPNSDLGEAYTFVIDNERRLSAFARQPHAPLDNNRCERELRICVRLRESGRFFRNAIGAGVADAVLTNGGTAQAARVNLFDYFVAVQRHAADVREHPEEWVPWRYEARLAQITGPPADALPTGPPAHDASAAAE
jgi:transposase